MCAAGTAPPTPLGKLIALPQTSWLVLREPLLGGDRAGGTGKGG